MKKWFLSFFVFGAVLVFPTLLLIQVLQKRPTISTTNADSRIPSADSIVRHTIFGLLTDDDKQVTPAPTNLQVASSVAGEVALRWSIVESERVTGYRVYRDGEFLGIVTDTAFGDSNTLAGRTYTYSILSLSSANIPSESVSISVAVTGPLAVLPKPINTPTTNTNATPTNGNTNTTTQPIVSPPESTTNSNNNTNASVGTNINTSVHVGQTIDMHVTRDTVIGDSTVTISTGDSIRFILDETGGELQIRFTPSPGFNTFTLDQERKSKTVVFTTLGSFSFSATEDDQDLSGTITVLAI